MVFLLLIFFMVTTTFTRETRLTVNLPEADAPLADVPANIIEIVISQNGRYAINGRGLVNSRLETLMQALEEISEGDRSMPVLLIADANTAHQYVVTAMDGIGQLGFSRLSIATQRPTVAGEVDEIGTAQADNVAPTSELPPVLEN